MTWEQVISHLTSLAQGDLFCDMDNSFWDIEVSLKTSKHALLVLYLSNLGLSEWVGVADAQDPGDPGPVDRVWWLGQSFLWRQHEL